jgi:hypothetical protein
MAALVVDEQLDRAPGATPRAPCRAAEGHGPTSKIVVDCATG